MKMNRPCLRKGVAIGRAAAAVNELYVQISVLDEVDVEIAKGAVAELKKALGPLKRNLKGASTQIQAIEATLSPIEQAMKKDGVPAAHEHLKVNVRSIQGLLREAVKTGFAECGAPRVSDADMADLMDDNAYYTDKPAAP